MHDHQLPAGQPQAVLLAHNTPAAGKKGEEKQLNVGGLRQHFNIYSATAGGAVAVDRLTTHLQPTQKCWHRSIALHLLHNAFLDK
jgi:hypothetical protein